MHHLTTTLTLALLLSGCQRPGGDAGDSAVERQSSVKLLAASASNIGWMLLFEAPERSAKIYYRLEDEPDFSEAVQNMVPIPLGTKPVKVLVKYEDSVGVMHGPFEFVHDPQAAWIAQSRQALAMLTTGWVSLGNRDGTKLIYWTTLQSYRCALDIVEYGVNTMTPTMTFDPGECNAEDPFSIPYEMQTYSFLPEDAEFVSVRLVYTDGTKSKVQKFDRFENF